MLKQHMAVQGDVWDLLSYQLYGDEGFIHILLGANPDLRHTVQFEKQTVIYVPDRPQVRAQASSNLPPWKQV